ncbi:TPA: acetyl-CoA acetyltransferase [bacterium]|nr:MAG: acetyl-CoA acetyltransferase [Candidatus Hydrogenedentes bacterium CG1_02_42_14]PIU48354.1 MAG: acetyl-CoA acetyltransferase [Candidatus Hydrogenedentes bacterium CG07_land_8_20_14_0_80_42_17]HBW46727.1 acetyl-CoA acetyltransferase [bacterium]
MREVYIVGIGITSFGRLEYPLVEIASYPSVVALQDAGLDTVDHLFVANMGGGRINHQTALSSAVLDHLSLWPAGSETIENGPASGSSAVKLGFQAIASGMCETVLVAGAERMSEVNQLDATDFVATLTHPMAEQIYGITLPALAGMFTRLYMEKYGVTRRHLAMVAVKNHGNAMDNFFAHVHTRVTLEGILDDRDAETNNPVIADPLHFFDMCPVSDGGAAVVLASKEVAKKLGKPMIRIAGVGQATDTHAVHERPDPTELTAVRLAAKRAFEMAKIEPKDVNVAELHDAFTILEIAESEEVGFFKKGEGHLALERGETQLTGKIPINPSGGLKAKGHPVGATGVAQVHEIVLQLRGQAEKRQVKDPKIGFTCNFGGFGNNVVCTVIKKEE